jgi:hypothetical protein
MFHVIDTTIVNSYIMYKAHMAQFGKSAEAMSHLKFNVTLVRAFMKKRCVFYSNDNNNGSDFNTQSRGFALFYAMDRNITEKEDVCGVYKEGQLVWSCLQ